MNNFNNKGTHLPTFSPRIFDKNVFLSDGILGEMGAKTTFFGVR